MMFSPRITSTQRLACRHGLGKATSCPRFLSTTAHKRSAVSYGGLKDILRISEEVQDAITTNKPVVALESTIYTHGAIEDLGLEDIVRRNGAVPAVCGIFAGTPTVGLLPHEIDRMVNEKAHKVSRRDISNLVGKGLLGYKEHGGTTISGTMILARLAGIRVFGTGGLGGVHRGGHDSMDISADLTELGRTRVAVVASGCKGFLDIPRTLEYLETQGVVVSTFLRGRTADKVTFPGFWATDSGFKTPSTVKSEEEAAAIIYAQEKMGIESGLLFANPIAEQDSIPKAEMDAIIEQAVSESTRQAASGNENTPFMLKRIRELTEGRSVTANVALVRSNVECAAKIAVSLSQLENGQSGIGKAAISRADEYTSSKPFTPKPKALPQADIVVAGSVAVDLTCDHDSAKDHEDTDPHLYTSNPGIISRSIGGVGRNVALAAHRASSGTGVRFCSMILIFFCLFRAGDLVLKSLESSGMDISCIQKPSAASGKGGRTAQYVAINGSDKNLFLAMADMNIFTSNDFSSDWDNIVAQSKPKWLVVDASWAPSGIYSWIRAAKRNRACVAFEPVSQAKSERLFGATNELGTFPYQSVDLSTPNQYELESMHKAALANGHFKMTGWSTVHSHLINPSVGAHLANMASQHHLDIDALRKVIELLPYIPTLITKLGPKGAVMAQIIPQNDPRLSDPDEKKFILEAESSDRSQIGGIYLRFYPPVENVKDVVSVNGVGDTFLGVLIAGLASGGSLEKLVDVAQKGAIMTLRSSESNIATPGGVWCPSRYWWKMPVPPVRKTAKACEPCRRRKIRCDGFEPCTNCHSDPSACAYRLKTRHRGSRLLPGSASLAHPSQARCRHSEEEPSPSASAYASGQAPRTPAAQDPSPRVYESVAAAHHAPQPTDSSQLFYGPSSNFAFLQQVQRVTQSRATSSAHAHGNYGGLDMFMQRNVFFGVPLRTTHLVHPPDPPIVLSSFLANSLAVTFLADFKSSSIRYLPFFPPSTLDRFLDEAFSNETETTCAPLRKTLLLLILAIGALKSTNNAELADRMFLEAKRQFGVYDDAVTISTIQISLLMTDYQLNMGRPNSAYLHVGNACRKGMALGLAHVTRGYSYEEMQERNATLWSLYFYETWLALASGRRSMIHKEDVGCPYPDGQPLLANLCNVGAIIEDIAASLYNRKTESLRQLHVKAQALYQRLQQWSRSLGIGPSCVPSSEPDDDILTTLILHNKVYFHLVHTTFRPFLIAESVLQQDGNRKETGELWLRQACRNATDAAIDSIVFMDAMLPKIDANKLQRNDSFYIEASCTVLLYDSLRHPSKHPNNLIYINMGLGCLQAMPQDDPITSIALSISRIVNVVQTFIAETDDSARSEQLYQQATALMDREFSQARTPRNLHVPPLDLADSTYSTAEVGSPHERNQQLGVDRFANELAPWLDLQLLPLTQADSHLDVLTTDLSSYFPNDLTNNSVGGET
ncbi:Pseudouridine-metabolizing bifunctional protein [Paramyrothecium foliicola]|nr:Pseudouridine-metabolizing bifunctional protein [Paramyrothecium foliicola]